MKETWFHYHLTSFFKVKWFWRNELDFHDPELRPYSPGFSTTIFSTFSSRFDDKFGHRQVLKTDHHQHFQVLKTIHFPHFHPFSSFNDSFRSYFPHIFHLFWTYLPEVWWWSCPSTTSSPAVGTASAPSPWTAAAGCCAPSCWTPTAPAGPSSRPMPVFVRWVSWQRIVSSFTKVTRYQYCKQFFQWNSMNI